MQQTSIPCFLMRGGSSKGLYFHKKDLPRDPELRDRVLVAAMGEDKRQIDGAGGAHPLTSKVAIVSRSENSSADVDYLFAQVVVGEGRVDTTPNCGNMLAAVGAFAIETGLVDARDGETSVRVRMLNSDNLCELLVQTPGKRVAYDGDARIDGVPGTAAPVICNYLDVAGSICGSLLPTGNVVDEVDGVRVTCVDNGMPVVVLRAADFGITGYETPAELDANEELKRRLESVRLAIGPRMNLGDVTTKVVPKMTLIAPPRAGGHVSTRTFIPHDCHAAIGVLGAVSVATACILPGSVAEGIARVPEGRVKQMSVEHPSGEFSVTLTVGGTRERPVVEKAGLLRTARLIMKGEIQIPGAVWDGAK
ncbi:MAG TPA: 4-oxalomesaconate tautomerase [Gammaproteobacteria bacterium]|nr:4-oxalomesaconate tautomerase [Gammaproteobacteria bacterium]